jgi:L-aminopeptidase/D-esterase-like protein
VGVLVQANYGRRETLTVAGVPVGRELPLENPHAQIPEQRARTGSIVVIIATDAPLLPPNLKAMAKRATVGLARVGGDGQTSSGDLFLAFSTANPNFPGYAPGPEKTKPVTVLTDWEILSDLYTASAQATEEAIVNALVAAETMVGFKGSSVQALPHRQLQDSLRKYGRLTLPEARQHP